MFFRKNKTRGFSLFELVLAIAIFSLSSYAIVTLLIDANLSTELNLQRTAALFYAKEGVEAVRSIRDNDWADLIDGVHGLDSSSGNWVFSSSLDLINNKYTRTVNIETDMSTTSIKKVSVRVEWPLVSNRVVSVSLDTILTNWK